VFFGKKSRKWTSREIPEIPEKKSAFSGFQDDAKIQPISGKSAEPGKSDVFGGKFPENPESGFGNSGKFRKKSAKTSILENSTLVCRAF
jgi:hypothetical protein